MAAGQIFQAAIFFPVVLNKHIVPNLNNLGMVFVDECVARDEGAVGVGPHVYVYFRAGATGAGFAHLPKIVFFIAKNNLLGRQ